MANVLAGIVLMWPASAGSIPSGWSRETALDGRFPKAWGTQTPNTSGGANSHSHTGAQHSHSMSAHSHTCTYSSFQANGESTGGTNNDPLANTGHGHASSAISTIVGGAATDTINWPASANNNRPPYFDLIFIKPSGSSAAIAEDMIGLWNSASVPSNWLACTDGGNGAPALGNKYLRGADTSQDGGTTGGSLTHEHDLAHQHSTSHYHTGNTGLSDNNSNEWNQAGAGSMCHSHTHTVSLPSQALTTDAAALTYTSGTVEPAYKKVLAIQRQSGGVTLPKGLIALWLGDASSVPYPWKLCNGQVWEDGINYTPDLRDKYIKIANDTGEIGNTGGANTHDHSDGKSHSHTVAGTHNHNNGGGVEVGPQSSITGSTASAHLRAAPHNGHTVTSCSSTATSWASTTMNTNGVAVNHEPEYLTAAYIQVTREVISGAAFVALLN